MPNKKSKKSKKKTPKRCTSARSNQGSDQFEARHSELSQLELEVRGVSLTPSKEPWITLRQLQREGHKTQDALTHHKLMWKKWSEVPYRTMIGLVLGDDIV